MEQVIDVDSLIYEVKFTCKDKRGNITVKVFPYTDIKIDELAGKYVEIYWEIKRSTITPILPPISTIEYESYTPYYRL